MRIYKRASAAYAAAGDQPVLTIHSGRETIYIVGVERMTDVSLITAPQKRGFSTIASRAVAGQILLGHLDRLGNGNHAGAAHYRTDEVHAFDLKGLGRTFLKPDDRAAFEADREAAKPA